MPRTKITMIEGKSVDYKQAIYKGIYDDMVNTFSVPTDDIFMSIDEQKSENICYGKNYLNIARTDDLLMIEIIANNSRNIDQKKAFYAAVVKNLVDSLKVRPEDIFIGIIEVTKENWSFGNGIAQYV